MSPEKHRHTFLSYSRINKDFALKLAKELKADGFLVWLDQLDIPTGARWDDELEKALEKSDIFMVILTPSSIASDNVKDEIGYAIDNGKRILPILLKDAKVPLRLRRFQYVDFTTKSFDEGIASAKQLLRNLIEEPTIPIPKKENPSVSQDKEFQAKAQESIEKVDEQSAEANMEAERIARQEAKSEQLEAERKNVLKASALLSEGKKLLQNQDWPGAVQIFKQVLTLTPNHSETKKLLSDAEAKIQQEHESADRQAKAEADRLARQKAEDTRLEQEKVERLEKQEAERFAAQKAENDRRAREETERLARLKAEEEKLAREKQELEKIRLQTQAQAPEPAPTAYKPETMSATPKKKVLSKPLMIGIGVGVSLVLVVCAVLGVGMLFVPTDPPISDPPIAVDPPIDVIPVTGDCPFDDSQFVEVYVENYSDFNLDYYWIDYDCQEQYQGTLNAGEAMTLGTYVSHAWEFKDNQTGDYYYTYEADGGDYLAIPGNGSACPFDGSQYVDVYVENLSGYNLDYFWVDYDCQEQHWGSLNAGESMTLGTYVSHIWNFYDNQTGDFYFGYEADGGDYLAIPGNDSAPEVTGDTVIYVSYDGGEFFQTGELEWTETSYIDGTDYYFEEYDRDEWSVYLYDNSRDVYIQLDLWTREINVWNSSDESWSFLFSIEGVQ